MKGRKYCIYDVFTDEVLTGNPLAIVLDTAGLDTQAMQRIAGEFNLSETVFVLPPENPRHRAKIRIFTPGKELPFAGHPTVGTAIALAQQSAGPNTTTEGILVLEENVVARALRGIERQDSGVCRTGSASAAAAGCVSGLARVRRCGTGAWRS